MYYGRIKEVKEVRVTEVGLEIVQSGLDNVIDR